MDINRIKNLVRKILAQVRFKIQESKLKVRDQHQKQIVTGIVVNQKLNPDRNYIRELRAAINSVAKGVTPRVDSEPVGTETIKGRIDYVARLNPLVGGNLLARFNKAMTRSELITKES